MLSIAAFDKVPLSLNLQASTPETLDFIQQEQKYPQLEEMQDGMVGSPPLRVSIPNLEAFLWVITAPPINTVISEPRVEFNSRLQDNKEQLNSQKQR